MERSDQRSQFCCKGGWYKVNTKGNGGGGKGSGTDYREHRAGKKGDLRERLVEGQRHGRGRKGR